MNINIPVLQIFLFYAIIIANSKETSYYKYKINFVQVFITMCALNEVKGMCGYYDKYDRV